MRLLSLDYDPVYGEDTTRSTFSGDISVFDYDAVIWDPAQTYRHYYQHRDGSYRGLITLSDGMSVTLNSDIQRRQREFKEFIETGRTVVAIVRPPQEFYIDTGRANYSGTGRNQKRTRIVDKVDLWTALPIHDLSLSVAHGSRFNVHGSSPLGAFLRKYRNYAQYDAIFTFPAGTTLASVTGTSRIVSSYMKAEGGGLLVLIPALNLQASEDDELDEDDDDTWVDDAPNVQVDLLDAITAMTENAIRAHPTWSLRYETAEQSKLRENIVKQEARVETARKRLTRLIEQRDRLQARNQLFLGTGEPLAMEVKIVLELLGGKVTQPNPERDDWKVTFPEGNAVVEVKGVSKSAAEKHAAQLEKWVAGEFEESGVAPKGILVINTWRETELSERRETDFPDQMLPYCEGRGHCLITGLQMFCIRLDIERDTSRADYWREKILTTSGLIKDVPDWQSKLIVTDDEQSSGAEESTSI
ncbi:hypothetical protein [Mycobacteroides abscessus]|uniref:hypothetical protein n=1 Tax=Mycobacteroides abscessus TaxID=36809 RepID=UPI0009A82A94|nr:hypothetical protein [Mycobacteroides abscessus]